MNSLTRRRLDRPLFYERKKTRARHKIGSSRPTWHPASWHTADSCANRATSLSPLKAKFHLARHVTSRHDTTRSTCRASRACRDERAVWQARHSQNAWARHVERVVLCGDVTWRAKWNLGLRQLGSRAFAVASISSWNSLPTDIRTQDKVSTLIISRHLKTNHLFPIFHSYWKLTSTSWSMFERCQAFWYPRRVAEPVVVVINGSISLLGCHLF